MISIKQSFFIYKTSLSYTIVRWKEAERNASLRIIHRLLVELSELSLRKILTLSERTRERIHNATDGVALLSHHLEGFLFYSSSLSLHTSAGVPFTPNVQRADVCGADSRRRGMTRLASYILSRLVRAQGGSFGRAFCRERTDASVLALAPSRPHAVSCAATRY